MRQLQIFDAVARHLSFSRASQELHLTQPAVSMQVKQLELRAGISLLDRAGRRVQLTEAGEEMVRCARRVLRELQDAEDAFAALRGVRKGRLYIAVVSTAKYFAPKLLALFARDHPDLEMKLAVHNRDTVVELLQSNQVDLVLMGMPPEHLDTTAVPFARHPLVVIAPPGHPLATRRRHPVSELETQSFLVREPGSGTRAAMERFFAEHRIRPVATTEISSNETIKQAVMAGMGLGFISQHAIGLELSTNQLALVHADGLPVMRNWNLVYLAGKRLSPAAQAFERFVLKEGRTFLSSWLPGDQR